MSSRTPPSALILGRTPDGERAMQRSFLWLLGSLGTAGGLFGLTALMAAGNEREAGRMMIAAQQGTGYLAAVTAGFAANQGRPNR